MNEKPTGSSPICAFRKPLDFRPKPGKLRGGFAVQTVAYVQCGTTCRIGSVRMFERGEIAWIMARRGKQANARTCAERGSPGSGFFGLGYRHRHAKHVGEDPGENRIARNAPGQPCLPRGKSLAQGIHMDPVV